MLSTREGTEEEPVRLGVVGCADIAWRRVLPAAAEASSITVTAIASRDSGKARRFAERFGCEAVTGYKALLDRDDIDAVYIPLPVGIRHDWVETALHRGLHVLSEKPLTTDASSAEFLVGEAHRLGLVLMEAFAFRHHSQHRAVARLVEEGAIGAVRSLMCEFGVPERADDDIRYRPDLGGGALLDVGVYPLGITRALLGDDLRVTGASLSFGRGVDLGGGVLIEAPEGVTAQLGFGLGTGYRNTYTLWGETGSITVGRAFTPPPTLTPLVDLESGSHTRRIDLEPDHQFLNLLEAFADGVRGRAPVATDPILAQARLVDRVRAASDPSGV
ncbi:NDP-hexose-3-ketoreductase [Nocardiopsis sp. Huas11]|uniref:Gfo/Idh/MocA family protein n=1 Tax=Nocardiopsis sp. Huas11 TaxID=2183912 RepID=UPI000F1817CE|nr:Gfo/Idh/MocA family oxidoreductase [Nocardiopsis sp. Huas11]RKS06883.1 NDP-hexose-3-ketoreductase [Nocardiopsis sp. Huas11]